MIKGKRPILLSFYVGKKTPVINPFDCIERMVVSCQRYYDVIASLRSNPEARNQAWIASCLIMTKSLTHTLSDISGLLRSARNDVLHVPSLRGTKQSRSSNLYLDCFAPLAMTATRIVITLFCRGIFPMPAARNDDASK